MDNGEKRTNFPIGEDNIVNTSGGKFIKSFNLQTKVKTLAEQLYDITNTYLSTDLDYFTMDQITSDIHWLENVINQWDTDDDVSVQVGLLSDCIASLYVARGLATSDVPRDRLYYQNMQNIRRLFLQLKNIA